MSTLTIAEKIIAKQDELITLLRSEIRARDIAFTLQEEIILNLRAQLSLLNAAPDPSKCRYCTRTDGSHPKFCPESFGFV